MPVPKGLDTGSKVKKINEFGLLSKGSCPGANSPVVNGSNSPRDNDFDSTPSRLFSQEKVNDLLLS